MVVKVSENEISSKERETGQTVTMPHGMVVWSTGIGARHEIVDFMKQLGQVCICVCSSQFKRLSLEVSQSHCSNFACFEFCV